jgi:fucose permease
MKKYMKKNTVILSLLPIFFGFFVMGLVDVVGISTNYVKDQFGLSESVSGFLPSVVFIWFFLLSYPIVLIMNKIGKKHCTDQYVNYDCWDVFAVCCF